MTRYFYTDAIAAAWMAKHFGMQYVCGGDSCMTWESIQEYDMNGKWEWDAPIKPIAYIHPDSLFLIEPTNGDVMYVPEDPTQKYPYAISYIWRPFFIKKDDERAVIVMRDNKPFFMPQKEVKESQ